VRQLLQVLQQVPVRGRVAIRGLSSEGASKEAKAAAESSPMTRAEIAARFEAVEAKMAGEFKAVRSEMKAGFQEVNAKFDAVNAKIDTFNAHINRMAAGAGATFLAMMGIFGTYTLGNSRDVGRMDAKLERNNNLATPRLAPVVVAPGKK